MSEPFPEATTPASSRTEVFLRYLDYFRSRVMAKLEALPAAEWRRARLPSGWTPLQLLKHLRHVERRWLEWASPAATWVTRGPTATAATAGTSPTTRRPLPCWLTCDQAERSRAIIVSHDLEDVGQPGDRRDGADPATRRVLFHLLQEYARHLGQLDVVVELATGLSEE